MSHKMSVQKQDQQINQEMARLSELFAELPPEKMRVAQPLMERVAFMTITLQLLEEEIKAKGPTIKFKNGSQSMIIENPSQKSYNTMINRYTAAYDRLINLLPKPVAKPVDDNDDDFDDFVNSRGD